ncbi:MAG: hypothetical protein SFY66_00735 [Oculatellaceae cyanobacterium bins.114]|nr:hypothetical protein [Oculatellaceae cyanobacterium bins.114]
MLEPNPDGQQLDLVNPPKVGFTMADVLALPDLERQLINWLQRQPDSTLAAAIASLSQTGAGDESAIRTAFDGLLERGFIRTVKDAAEPRYRVHLGSMRANRPQSYWKRLCEDE